MTTEAQIGIGATFSLADNTGPPGVLTLLSEIISITPPNSQTAEVEATHFGSTGRRREYIAGLIDDGEGAFEMNYVPGSTTDVLIRGAQASGLTKAYKIVVPDGAGTWKIEGSCIVKGYERNIPIDDRMTATMTVRFTGAVTEAAGP